jgi:undecaprenyl-diphosphatase
MTIVDVPLLARRHRPLAVAVVLACAALVAVLAVRYANQSRAGALDRAVDDWISNHVNYRTALWFADLGNPPVVIVATVAVVVFAVWLRHPRGVLLAVLAPSLASSLTEYVLKPAVNRTKDGYLAYPSGHTTGWCTVMLVLLLLVLGPARPRLADRTRRWVAFAATVLGLACAIGLIGPKYHYATDVIGGLGVSIATVLVLALLIDQLAAAVRPAPTRADAADRRRT